MIEGIPDDFRDLLVELVDAGARFLVVGGYAVAVHGHPRATKDIDVWVEPTTANAGRVYAALARFGAPVSQFEISAGDFEAYDGVLQLGVAPVRIDILTRIGGVEFAETWEERTEIEVEGRKVPVLGLRALIKNKRFAGRAQDLADVEALERLHFTAERGSRS
jgi:predicted nucleotidyltransferase